jgi:hypothetical protein
MLAMDLHFILTLFCFLGCDITHTNLPPPKHGNLGIIQSQTNPCFNSQTSFVMYRKRLRIVETSALVLYPVVAMFKTTGFNMFKEQLTSFKNFNSICYVVSFFSF